MARTLALRGHVFQTRFQRPWCPGVPRTSGMSPTTRCSRLRRPASVAAGRRTLFGWPASRPLWNRQRISSPCHHEDPGAPPDRGQLTRRQSQTRSHRDRTFSKGKGRRAP
ncbi:hypothetical protein M885DRAFT_515222, partial [Pelagophyceae sp. CCMP2097]